MGTILSPVPASANCVAVAAAITCSSAGGVQAATVGLGAPSNNTSVDVLSGALVSTGNSAAISLNNNAVITVRTGATVQNFSTGADSPHGGGIGANTIEVNNNSTITIEQGGSVFADGSANNSEAINPLGSNNTIVNNGTIRSTNTAIWFQSNSGENTVVNTGRIEAGYSAGSPNGGTSAVLGANGTTAVDFTNRGDVVGSLNFAGGNDALRIYTGSSITGNINGGGGANLLTLNSADNGSATFAPLSLSGFQTLDNNSGTWTLNVALPTSGIATTTVRGGTLILGANASTYKGQMAVEQAGVLQSTAQFAPFVIENKGLVRFAQPADGTYTGLVNGSGGIEKSGMGVLSLTADQTFTGLTTISGGTLQLGTGAAAGSVQGDILNNGTLAVNRSNALTLQGLISGSGDLQQVGGGTTVLTGNNTYAGGTTVSKGTLQLGDGGTTGSITGDVLNNSVLAFNRADTVSFDGAVSGSGNVAKLGTGTTVLTGNNTYTGGTTIAQGTLQLGNGGTTGSIVGNVLNDGGLIFNRSDTVAFSGAVTGSGSVVQQGAGTTVLAGANAYTGATDVAQGILRAGAANTFSAASAHTVAAGATLDTAGFNQTVASLNNSGTVSLLGTVPGSTLTVDGNYVGNNGLLRLGTSLGDSGSASDRLVLNGGSATGTTRVQITNIGGLGALTSGDGINVVAAQNGATTATNAFSLAGGHVDAGAFEYRLYDGDAAGAGENWYLRSTAVVTPPVDPGTPGNPGTGPGTEPGTPALPPLVRPTYRAEVPMYAALPAVLRQADLTMLSTLHRRMGDEGGAGIAGGNTAGNAKRAWGRVLGGNTTVTQSGTTSPESRTDLSGIQAGVDVFANDRWNAGVYVGRLRSDADVRGVYGLNLARAHAGGVRANTTYLGGYATYANPNGLYVDAVLQYGIQDIAGHSANFSSNADGKSITASLEVGKRLALSASWAIEPQAQLIYNRQKIDGTWIGGLTSVEHDTTSAVIGRLGVRLTGDFATGMGRLQPYARVNLWHGFNGTDSTNFLSPAGTTRFDNRIGYTSVEVAGGATLNLTPTTSIYGELGSLMKAGGQSRVKSSLQGSVGVKVRF